MSNLEEFNKLEKTLLCQLLELRDTAFNLRPRAQEDYKGRELTTKELLQHLERGVRDGGESLDALQGKGNSNHNHVEDVMSRIRPMSDEESRGFVRDLIGWYGTHFGDGSSQSE
ncbi:MAG: hypothetical protein M1305_03090 [Candidatus Marsarchaeota archaeon]|nr:hypothetical protein [Candidatus Marsarchaeota archaeon]